MEDARYRGNKDSGSGQQTINRHLLKSYSGSLHRKADLGGDDLLGS